MSTAKDFYVGDDVVTGYKNLSSGLYQDVSGLNIQNLGLRNLPGITGILDSMRTTAPKYPGYFDYYNASDLITNPKSFFNFFKQPTPQEIVQQRGLAKQNMAEARDITQRIQKQTPPTPQDLARGGGGGGGKGDLSGGRSSSSGEADYGGFCFDPNTPVQMADGSEKKIKDIKLGEDTKGGEVTGVFQFKAADEIHDYKGVTVAGSHYVKENGKFIMVKDSPLAVKIDKIPVVYSLDTTGRRIFINDIEFADYNGDGIAKNFLNNAGVDLSGFDKEVLRQVENRIL
jgi:hypothetical protein